MHINISYIMTLSMIHGIKKSVIADIMNCMSQHDNMSMDDIFNEVTCKGMGDHFSREDLRMCEGRAKEVIEKHEQAGIHIISLYDKIYPEAFRYTTNERGRKISPPLLLFCKGNLSLLHTPCITIIGARSCTDYAFHASEIMAEKFVERGFTIVSGLASGCDTAAHQGALKAHGKTIAILAHGLDMVYPAKNTALAESIVHDDGLLISEYPMGKRPAAYTFVARDRLQAALSLATVVIQTGTGGGSMHAVRAAYNANKPVFVVDHDDEKTMVHKNTQGNLELIRNGAIPVKIYDDFDCVVNYI